MSFVGTWDCTIATPIGVQNVKFHIREEAGKAPRAAPRQLKAASSLSARVDESIFANAACGRMSAKPGFCHGKSPAARLPHAYPASV